MNGAPEPVAWLLREHRGGWEPGGRIMCGKVFMREEAALPAAERETNTWRDVKAVPVFAEPLPPVDPAPTWRCFHCDDVFTDRAAAAAHFGADEGRTPACQIKASEGGLVRALREAEDECERVHTQLHAESADGLRALQNNLGRHRTAMIAQEETGYERGIADMADVRRIAASLLLAHEAIEAHCRVETGAKGQDHADEGQRIRRAVRWLIATAREVLDIPQDKPLAKPSQLPTPPEAAK